MARLPVAPSCAATRRRRSGWSMIGRSHHVAYAATTGRFLGGIRRSRCRRASEAGRHRRWAESCRQTDLATPFVHSDRAARAECLEIALDGGRVGLNQSLARWVGNRIFGFFRVEGKGNLEPGCACSDPTVPPSLTSPMRARLPVRPVLGLHCPEIAVFRLVMKAVAARRAPAHGPEAPCLRANRYLLVLPARGQYCVLP